MALARHQIFACAPRPDKNSCKTKIKPKDVQGAVQHAQLICYNFEDTKACRLAWDAVEDLSRGLAKQRERELLRKNLEEMCLEDPDSCKFYDV
jgi:hypothetical protein